jgi:hypothetical protein
MTSRRTLVSLCLVAAALSACSETSMVAPPSLDLPLTVLQIERATREPLPRGATVSVSLRIGAVSEGRMTLSVRDQTGAALLASEPSVDLVPQQTTVLHATFAVPAGASSILAVAHLYSAGAATPVDLHFAYATR